MYVCCTFILLKAALAMVPKTYSESQSSNVRFAEAGDITMPVIANCRQESTQQEPLNHDGASAVSLSASALDHLESVGETGYSTLPAPPRIASPSRATLEPEPSSAQASLPLLPTTSLPTQLANAALPSQQHFAWVQLCEWLPGTERRSYSAVEQQDGADQGTLKAAAMGSGLPTQQHASRGWTQLQLHTSMSAVRR